MARRMRPRAHGRTKVLWNANLHFREQVLECQVLDLSKGGAKIYTRVRFGIDAEVELIIGELGVLPGEIRWQNGNHAGIKFRDHPDVVGRLLSSVLHECAAELVPMIQLCLRDRPPVGTEQP